MRVLLVLLGAAGALGGCVRPPPFPMTGHNAPLYRAEPAPSVPAAESSSARPASRPSLPLPVPPQYVSPAAAACTTPGSGARSSGALSETRKQQLFKRFAQLESGNGGAAVQPSAPARAPGGPPPCPPAAH